jgi:hypothetical protein
MVFWYLEYIDCLKIYTALVTPIITIIPPYNEITITHKKIEPSLPATLAKKRMMVGPLLPV